MSKATSSTRSVMITRSLCPRSFWTCCANCTRMLPSSPKLEPLGREHSNCTSWAQRTVAPQLRPLWKFSFWTFCTANGKLLGGCMAPDRELDTNDKALMQYFLRGMRRFEKHVRSQDIVAAAADTLEARIEAAYRLARAQFTPIPNR